VITRIQLVGISHALRQQALDVPDSRDEQIARAVIDRVLGDRGALACYPHLSAVFDPGPPQPQRKQRRTRVPSSATDLLEAPTGAAEG
jgi:hypothetical protein